MSGGDMHGGKTGRAGCPDPGPIHRMIWQMALPRDGAPGAACITSGRYWVHARPWFLHGARCLTLLQQLDRHCRGCAQSHGPSARRPVDGRASPPSASDTCRRYCRRDRPDGRNDGCPRQPLIPIPIEGQFDRAFMLVGRFLKINIKRAHCHCRCAGLSSPNRRKRHRRLQDPSPGSWYTNMDFHCHLFRCLRARLALLILRCNRPVVAGT